MKTIQDYQNLKVELQTIQANHKETHLDPVFISVKASNMNWREAKKLGMKKEFDGWYFYTTSTNSNGYELYEKIKKACKEFNLFVSQNQL